MDQPVRTDTLGRLPEWQLLVLSRGDLVSFNGTAETLLGLALQRFRGVPILAPEGLFPLERGNTHLGVVLEESAGEQRASQSEVAVTTADGRALSLEVTVQRREWGADAAAPVLLFQDASQKQRIREVRSAARISSPSPDGRPRPRDPHTAGDDPWSHGAAAGGSAARAVPL